MARDPVAAACVLVFLGACTVAVVECAARRLVCWQAIMNCQAETECRYAYGQYMHACEPVLSGRRASCPSHCIASLVQLNLTRGGPALEECSCNSDQLCRDTKRAIEPCVPRTSSLGCTEARQQCEGDPQCFSVMSKYLQHCSKLFGGGACTSACLEVIADMRRLPKGKLLDTCVCDGSDRTICEYIKLKMKTSCFGEPHMDDYGDDEGSGSEIDDEDEYRNCPSERSSQPGGRSASPAWGPSVVLVVLLETSLVLMQALS